MRKRVRVHGDNREDTSMRKVTAFIIVVALITTLLVPQFTVNAAGNYNYGEALQKSIMFYDFQRSGKLPADKRDDWRGDSGLTDGSDVGVDLTGGWYDAGDHVKFNLPMAYTTAMLAWSVYEDRAAYEKSGQLKYIMDEIKWASDYFIKCHTAPNEYYYQVGDGVLDHGWWGPVEVMPMARPSFKVTSSSGGATVVAQTAAALALTSIIFKDSDPTYAANCLKHAKELYNFAETTKSDTGYAAAVNFYRSWSEWWDELSWAGAWLYTATNDSTYIDKAESYVSKWTKEPNSTVTGYKWAHCWDDVHQGAAFLLARITNKDVYKELVEKHLDYWSSGYNTERIKYTPKGLAWLDTWGSLRYATTTAFLADLYAGWTGCTPTKVSTYKSFAKSQIDYALGNTGRSFVVGFGTNPPKRPHHRTSHGSWSNSQNEPPYHRHTLYGALVGGPDGSDAYVDDVSNYTTNEVACDYNAGFTGLLARMYDQYGGNPIPDFKAIEEKTNTEICVQGTVTSNGDQTDLRVFLYNKTGWPARAYDKLSFRYYLDLSELYTAGFTAKDVSVVSFHCEGGKALPNLVAVDEAKHIYYAVVDFSGTKVYPGGPMDYKKECQLRISAPQNSKAWDGTNDFSFKGDNTGAKENQYIPVYNDGVKLFGLEPGENPNASPIPTATVIPTPTKTPTATPTATPTVTPPTTEQPLPEFKVDTTFDPSKLVANQMITAKVTATNTSAASYEGKVDVLLIVALYDSHNTMVNVSYISKGITYQGTENLSAGFKLPRDITGYSVRSFVWDGQDMVSTNMIPLSNVTQLQ